MQAQLRHRLPTDTAMLLHILLQEDVLNSILDSHDSRAWDAATRYLWPCVCKTWNGTHKLWKLAFHRKAQVFRTNEMESIFMTRDVQALLAGMSLYRADESVQRVGCVYLRLWSLPVSVVDTLTPLNIEDTSVDDPFVYAPTASGSMPAGLLGADAAPGYANSGDDVDYADSQDSEESGESADDADMDGGHNDGSEWWNEALWDGNAQVQRTISTTKQLGQCGGIHAVVATIRAHSTAVHVVSVGVEALLQLCTTQQNITILSNQNAIHLLISIVHLCVSTPILSTKIITLLVLLCDGSDANRRQVVQGGAVASAIAVSKRSLQRTSINRLLCHAIYIFAVCEDTRIPASVVTEHGIDLYIWCLQRHLSHSKTTCTVCSCVAALVKNVDNKEDFRQKDGLRLLVNVVKTYAHNLAVRGAAAAAIGELAYKDRRAWKQIFALYGNEISHLAQHAAGLRIWPNHTITRYTYAYNN